MDFTSMKPNHLLFSLLIFSLGILSCKEGKTRLQSEQAISAPDKILSLLKEENLNGSFLIKEKGEIVLHGALGYRDYESKDPLGKDHQFYLASISKQITAIACLILVERGKLSLEDKLSDYYPELPYKSDISIKQMLTHTSGIPDYYGLGIYKTGMKNQDVFEALLDGTSLDFEPGSQYAYSNSAYVLLSMIAAKAANQSFKDFVHEHIFDVLGMKHSVVFDETAKDIAIRAKGHTENGEEKDYQAYTTGGGGIFSNTGDLGIWEKALYTDKLIPQSLLKTAYQVTKLSSGENSYYGFGWVLKEGEPNKVSHTGSLEGFRNIMVRDLDKKRLIIFLTNNSNGDLKRLCEEVEHILDKDMQ